MWLNIESCALSPISKKLSRSDESVCVEIGGGRAGI